MFLVGFHEAIGDVISLSVQTPKHLRKIGLLGPGKDDEGKLMFDFFSSNILLNNSLVPIVFILYPLNCTGLYYVHLCKLVNLPFFFIYP